MKWLVVSVVAVFICLCPVVSVNADGPEPSRFMDPLERERLSYADYAARLGVETLNTLRMRELHYLSPPKTLRSPGQDNPLVLIIVNEQLLPSISNALDIYMLDLAGDGYQVAVSQVSGHSPVLLRQEIISWWGDDLDGVVLIGDCPVAWFELDDYWGGEHEEFPIELYFMDLDGIWTDSDGDGLFDGHTGSVAPDIWVGRLDAYHFMDGAETAFLQNYFAKNHAYRTGTLTLPDRGLAYVDDDWAAWGDWSLSSAYADTVVINSNNQTTAAHYRSELQNGYEFVHLCAHSCPWVHVFLQNAGTAGCFFNFDLDMMEPHAFFYNLFSCSNARFVEWDCLGNKYLFKDSYGLAIVGSSKTGGMLDTEAFYPGLGAGETLGEAFLDWYQYEAVGGFSLYEKSWFYGMAVLGDPTLKMHQHGGSCSDRLRDRRDTAGDPDTVMTDQQALT
ncbi:MAG TPA: C25 family cysteine peptidase [bacterium]|nr:C25 family cysteine peptidase [bacterium]